MDHRVHEDAAGPEVLLRRGRRAARWPLIPRRRRVTIASPSSSRRRRHRVAAAASSPPHRRVVVAASLTSSPRVESRPAGTIVEEGEKHHCDTLAAMLKLLKKDKVLAYKQMFLMFPMHKDEEVTLVDTEYVPS